MDVLISIFGLILILAGVSLIVRPQIVFGFLANNQDKVWLYVGAIVARLVLGCLLVYSASISISPTVVMAIGWIMVVAAVIFAAIGRDRFRRLMSWALSVSGPYARAGGLGAVCFGVFLIYAFL